MKTSSSIDSSSSTTSNELTITQRIITNWLILDPSLLKQDDKNIYFFGGRLKTVKSKPINLITLSLILIPGILYWIFECRWHWNHISPSIVIVFSYLWLLTLCYFIRASFFDPGVLRKNLHKIEDEYPEEYSNMVTLPPGVNVRYCVTCKIFRPVRTSHCSTCDVCVLNHDHHCIFLNNCVGERNYKYFLWFLLGCVVGFIYLIIVSCLKLKRNKVVSDNPVSLLLIVYSAIGIIYPLGLLLFHLYLSMFNYTTREYLNYVYKQTKGEFTNHYDTHSIWKNLYINWFNTSGVNRTERVKK